ncbi:hypothetical protein ACVGW2_01460, partial [Enterobacter intestinihominis]
YRLASTAPGNQGLQIDYAALLQARGLPRAAEQNLKPPEALEPTNLELEKHQAYVPIDHKEWRQKDLLADDVISRAPGDPTAPRQDMLRSVSYKQIRAHETGRGIWGVVCWFYISGGGGGGGG